MGASAWVYVVPYQQDVMQALLDLQSSMIASGKCHQGNPDAAYDLHKFFPQIGSLEELRALKETDEFWEEGTHSILDMDRIISAGQPDEEGAIAPVPPDRARALFGNQRPAREDFQRAAHGNLHRSPDFPRWSGRYVVLYEDGRPHEIAFWGFSGD